MIAVFLIGADRIFKILAARGCKFEIAGEILKFDFKANHNIAFSLPFAGAWLNAAIAVIILLLVYFLLECLRNGKYGLAACVFFIALGAWSNLLDRIKYGFVVDYFDLKYFTVFNLADAMIAAGAFAALFMQKKRISY